MYSISQRTLSGLFYDPTDFSNTLLEALVQLAIGYFLESADIDAGVNDQALPELHQGILAHFPKAMQKGIDTVCD